MSVSIQMCLATVWLTNIRLSSGRGICFPRHPVRISCQPPNECGPEFVYAEAKQQRMKITTRLPQLRTN